MRWTPRVEWVGPFVWLVALHSFAVAAGLVLLPRLVLQIGGLPPDTSVFFVHQGGVFHAVVAIGYIVEWTRHRTITLMLIAKTLAAVFLCLSWMLANEPSRLVILSALGDAAMAAGAWWLSRALRS